MKNKIEKVGFHTIAIIIILYLSLWGISKNTLVTVLTDEYAYWLSAAWLNGKDWSASIGNYPYYGYGYGFLLAIIMKLIDNPIFMYQAALVLNSFMLICSYFIAYYCTKKLTLCNLKKCIFIAFISVSYASNLLYSRLTLSEVLLCFFIWVLFALLLKFADSQNKMYIILFLIVLTWMLSIHNRTIGIFVAGIVSYIFYCNKSFFKKSNICIILFLIFLLLVVFMIKEVYQNYMYRFTAEEVLSVTEVAGQLNKIKHIFSFDGFKELLVSFAGKIYYVSISSLSLVWFGTIYVIRKINNEIKEKSYILSVPYIFILIAFILLILISSVYTASAYKYRWDFLFYGRYIEFLYGPLLLFGILEILFMKNLGKKCCILGIFSIIVTFIVLQYCPTDTLGTNVGINCVGLSDIYYKTFDVKQTLIVGLQRNLFYLGILAIISLIYNRWKNAIKFCFIFSISILWIYIALYDCDERIYKWTEQTVSQNINFIENIDKYIDISDTLYLYDMDELIEIAYLQFLKQDAQITHIKNKKQLSIIPKGTVIISSNLTKVENLDNVCNLLETNYYFKAWQKK